MEAYAAAGPPPCLPVTESVSERILCLPAAFPEPQTTVARIVDLVREAQAEAPALRRKAEAA